MRGFRAHGRLGPLANEDARLQVVGLVSGVGRGHRGERSVRRHDDDASIARFLHDRHKRGRVGRIERDAFHAAVDHVLDRGDLRRRVAGGVGFGGHDVEPILLCRVDGGFFEPAEERIGKLQLDNADQKLLFLGLHGAWCETGANAHHRDRASRADCRAAGFRILTLRHALLLSSSRRLANPTLSVRRKPKPDCSVHDGAVPCARSTAARPTRQTQRFPSPCGVHIIHHPQANRTAAAIGTDVSVATPMEMATASAMTEPGTRSPLTVERRWIRACKSYGETANAFSVADRGWAPRASASLFWRFSTSRIARRPWPSNGSPPHKGARTKPKGV